MDLLYYIESFVAVVIRLESFIFEQILERFMCAHVMMIFRTPYV
jgi:hypothetical protein